MSYYYPVQMLYAQDARYTTHPANQPGSGNAARRVLGDDGHNFVEQILDYLAMMESKPNRGAQAILSLFLLQRVSPYFRDVISGSRKLQEHMFIVHPAVEPRTTLLSPMWEFFRIPYEWNRTPTAYVRMPDICGYDQRLYYAEHHQLEMKHAHDQLRSVSSTVRPSYFLSAPPYPGLMNLNASWRQIKATRSTNSPSGPITLIQRIMTRPPRSFIHSQGQQYSEPATGYQVFLQLDLNCTLGDLYKYYEEIFSLDYQQHGMLQYLANSQDDFLPTGKADRMGSPGPTQISLALQAHSWSMSCLLVAGASATHTEWPPIPCPPAGHMSSPLVAGASATHTEWPPIPCPPAGHLSSPHMLTKPLPSGNTVFNPEMTGNSNDRIAYQMVAATGSIMGDQQNGQDFDAQGQNGQDFDAPEHFNLNAYVDLDWDVSQDFDAQGQNGQDFDAQGQNGQDFDAQGQNGQDFDAQGQNGQDFDAPEHFNLNAYVDLDWDVGQDFDAQGQNGQDFDAQGQNGQDFDAQGQNGQDFDAQGQNGQDFDAQGQNGQDFDAQGQNGQDFDAQGQNGQDFDAPEHFDLNAYVDLDWDVDALQVPQGEYLGFE